MKIATFILALGVTVIMGLQACAVYSLSSLSDSLSQEEEASETTLAGAGGILVTFLAFVGMAFVLGKPGAARWIFGLAAVFAFLAGSSGFGDMTIYGVALLLLAFMASKSIAKIPPALPLDPVQEQRRLYFEEVANKQH